LATRGNIDVSLGVEVAAAVDEGSMSIAFVHPYLGETETDDRIAPCLIPLLHRGQAAFDDRPN